MGLATILIIVCHSTQGSYAIESSGIIRKLVIAGNYGVDVFLLLSGVGLYYSLVKVYEGKSSLLRWYKRRFSRILVPYFILVVPWLCVSCLLDGQYFSSFLWQASTLSYWTHHDGVWFLSLLLPLYLITPLYGWLERRFHQITGLVTILLWVVLIFFGPSSYEMLHIDKTNVVINIGFCLIRLPSFFLGYWLAPYIRRAVCIPCWLAIGLPFIGIIIAHLYYTHLLSLNYLCSGLLIVTIAICIMQKMGGAEAACYTLWESSRWSHTCQTTS